VKGERSKGKGTPSFTFELSANTHNFGLRAVPALGSEAWIIVVIWFGDDKFFLIFLARISRITRALV